MSTKDKRYNQQVEKALATFDSLDEWADYIAFLSRLQKALLLNNQTNATSIPYPDQIANKLSLCLSSKLPNGVHQKALALYESICAFLAPETLNSQLDIWLPGLLPLFSYCSIQVKPELIKIYKNHLLTKLTQRSLKLVCRPVILSLLPGLDDENSEAFSDTLALVDLLKQNLNDDAHFWQSLFLCIISSPERRLGALYWCTRRLPAFSTIKSQDDTFTYSQEANACLTPESGLLVRAFASAINTSTSFNPASDIIVVRGFFDLLLSHIPLNSDVLNKTISDSDKELLIMACCKVTLKKDMSLNRRLWNWFLGPENEDQSSISRSNYFETYGLQCLASGLLKLINSTSTSEVVDSFRISLAIIMDKWELSRLVTPKILAPILHSCYTLLSHPNTPKDVLLSARALFDGVEASYIWNEITCHIILGENYDLELLSFLLREFDFHEEEMVAVHIHLAIMALLISGKPVVPKWADVLETFLDLVQWKSLAAILKSDHEKKPTKDSIADGIKNYYEKLAHSETDEPPFEPSLTSFLCLDFLRDLYVEKLLDPISPKICDVFCRFLYNTPVENDVDPWSDRKLVDAILSQPVADGQYQPLYLVSAFNTAKLFPHFTKVLTPLEKGKLLKIVLSNLWTCLVSSCPANHQVEAVKHIFAFDIIFHKSHVEAGLLNLLLKSSKRERVRAFSVLWTHSASLSDADDILSKPLQVLLDDLCEEDKCNSLPVVQFVENVVKSGTTNRLLKLIINPLLNFEFMHDDRSTIVLNDDLAQFSYYMKIVFNVIKSNEKPIKDAFNSELAVIDRQEKILLIKANNWDVSTYKSLILQVAEKFVQLRLSEQVLNDEEALSHFCKAIYTALGMVSILVSGTEPLFATRFHILVNSCFYYINISDSKPFQIEMIERAFLGTIFDFLKIADNLKIDLNLLHVDDESTEPLLVKFIVQGIAKCQSSVLLESWFQLLTRSLYLFNESVFSVILILNDAIIQKILSYFDKISSFEVFPELIDLESSFDILASGLEDLLSISHSYLLTSKFTSGDKPANVNENGFLGNVINGVFQIESPALRTSEQNKLYSILLSFQDAIKVTFRIWKWADSKPQVPPEAELASDRSLSFLCSKLKFRSKKLMERLIELERLEVIETLIEIDNTSPEVIKVLHVLDGGRSQITLPPLLNSIVTRAYPLLLDEKNRSSLNVTLSVKSLAKFLLAYVDSIDGDTIPDVWDRVIQFCKDAIAHPSAFKGVFCDLLRVLKTFSVKIESSKTGERRKNRKELGDVFNKLLSIAASSKADEKDPEMTPSELISAARDIAEYIEYILHDSDKVNIAFNTIVSGVLGPQVKSRKPSEISKDAMLLMELVGRLHANKAWKSMVYEIFMHDSFFNVTLDQLRAWTPILSQWISTDKDKLSELLFRLSPSAQASASNIFLWNEKSEVESKIIALKRVCLLVLTQPQDYFLSSLEMIFERIEHSLTSSSPPVFKSQVFTLFRAVSMKFGELHLLSHWHTVVHELIVAFAWIQSKGHKEIANLLTEDVGFVLSSCKLLDQLRLLRFDEFNLNEWLFVSSQPDVITGTSKDTLFAAVDKISLVVEQIPTKDSPVKINQPSQDLQPLLVGVQKISSIVALRTFFDSLSLLCYERLFTLGSVNLDACEMDVFNDLVV